MIQVHDSHTLHYTVAPGKGVPDLYPESAHFCAMPPVFATGFLVGLMVWCCIDLLAAAAHLAPQQGTLGVAMDISHDGACTEGAVLTVYCTCTAVTARSLSWTVDVYCQDVLMGRGRHKRAIVDKQGFAAHVNRQAGRIGGNTVAWD